MCRVFVQTASGNAVNVKVEFGGCVWKKIVKEIISAKGIDIGIYTANF